MSAYGKTPMADSGDVGLGIAYVPIDVSPDGVVQTAGR